MDHGVGFGMLWAYLRYVDAVQRVAVGSVSGPVVVRTWSDWVGSGGVVAGDLSLGEVGVGVPDCVLGAQTTSVVGGRLSADVVGERLVVPEASVVGDAVGGGVGDCNERVGARCGDSGVGGIADGGSVVGAEGSTVSRGKHYVKNKAAKLRAARKRRMVSVGLADDGVPLAEESSKSVGSAEGDSVRSSGFFSGCSGGMMKELRETRAKRYVEENKLGAARAAAAVENMTLERKTRLNEARFELKRQRVEEKLAALYEKRLGGSAQDWVESLLSGVDEPVVDTPSLSVGSVSPSSSMSVEQEKRMRSALNRSVSKIRELEMQLAKFTGVLDGKKIVRRGTPDPYEGCFSDPPSIGVGDADFF